MNGFRDRAVSVPAEVFERARSEFTSSAADDDATCAMIARVWGESGYLLDPHTAIGLHAARACRSRPDEPMVALATAHPAKFPDAVRRAGVAREPELPRWLADLHTREERCSVLPRDRAVLCDFVRAHVA